MSWETDKARGPLVPLIVAVALAGGCGAADPGTAQGRLPACEWCGTGEAPAELDWQTRIAPPDEPGEPLEISGAVYRADGETPAPGVVVYLYHTNARGVYAKRGDETGNGRRHGYLRGWLRSGADGRYRFTTIRPASYPTRTEPAHIHVVVQAPGEDEQWLDSYRFADDPLLGEGRDGVVELERGADGVWRGTRDLVLGRRGDG